MANYSLAAMVILEIDDRQLSPENIDVSTAGGAASLRRVVMDNLCNASRLVAVMSEEEAQLMMMGHEYASRAAGIGEFNRPPADYVPPTRE